MAKVSDMAVLVRCPPRPQAKLPLAPYDCWRDGEGEVALEFRRLGEGFHLRFPHRADFEIHLGTGRVFLHAAHGEDESAASDLFDNQVIPLLAAYRGSLVLHASAVSVDGNVLGFLGASGRGKSTLAAAFARRGHPFLTDDGLTIEIAADRYMALASQPSLRLLPDSRVALLGCAGKAPDAKVRIIEPASFPHTAAGGPLAALFVLVEPANGRVRLDALGPGAAFDAIIGHSFMLDVTDKARMRAHFRQVTDLAEKIGCTALDYPRDFAQLDDVVDAIVDRARSI